MIDLIISHSEVDSFARCEQQHRFGFMDRLAPKKLSAGLDRGVRNHTVMESYFSALAKGATWTEAKNAATMTFSQMWTEPGVDPDVLNALVACVPGFFDVDLQRIQLGWKVLAVEKEYRLTFPPKVIGGEEVRITFAFKIDLIRQDPNGRNYVVDTKTVYNFYSQDEMALMPQVPKYVGALQALDMPIKGGIMNQMRWRKLKNPSVESTYRWDDLRLTEARVLNAFREHIKQMHRIALFKTNPDMWREEVTKTLSYMVCKNCSFKTLCQFELAGVDTTQLMQIDYVPNTYGYDLVGEIDG
jgi:hypothetical protein